LQSKFFSRQNYFSSKKFPFSKIAKQKKIGGKKLTLQMSDKMKNGKTLETQQQPEKIKIIR
jgi:hypothetical protein